MPTQKIPCPQCDGMGRVEKSYGQYHAELSFTPNAAIDPYDLCPQCTGDKYIRVEVDDGEAVAMRASGGDDGHPGWAAPEARLGGALLGAVAALVWAFMQGTPSLGFAAFMCVTGALLGTVIAYCIKPIVVLGLIGGAGWIYLRMDRADTADKPPPTPLVAQSAQPVAPASDVRKPGAAPKESRETRIARLAELRQRGDADALLKLSGQLRKELPKSHAAYVQAVGNHVWALSELHRWDEADRWIDEILTTRDDDWRSYAVRQRVQNRYVAKDWDGMTAMSASRAWSSDLRIDFLRHRAMLLLEWKPGLAVRDLQAALALRTDSASLAAELAEAEIIAGQPRSALNLPTRIARNDPDGNYRAIAWLLECIARRSLDLDCGTCELQIATARAGRWSFKELDGWLTREPNPHEDWIRKQIGIFQRQQP